MAKRKAIKSTRGKAPSPRGKKATRIDFEDDPAKDDANNSSDASQGAQDATDAPKFQKSKDDIKKEKEHEETRQKAYEQYKKDLKNPEDRHGRELKIIEDYIHKKTKSGEILMPPEDAEKLRKTLWSPISLFDTMKELGWENFYEEKRSYVGILFRQIKKTKKG